MAHLLLLLLALLSLLRAEPAHAADLETYEQLKRAKSEQARMHLDGLGDGMAWANIALEVRGDKPLYCPPRGIALNADNYMSLIDAEMKRSYYKKDTALGMVLMHALRRSFPCG